MITENDQRVFLLFVSVQQMIGQLSKAQLLPHCMHLDFQWKTCVMAWLEDLARGHLCMQWKTWVMSWLEDSTRGCYSRPQLVVILASHSFAKSVAHHMRSTPVCGDTSVSVRACLKLPARSAIRSFTVRISSETIYWASTIMWMRS